MSWDCPRCDHTHVVSKREFVAVYNWREIISETQYRTTDGLEAHGWHPKPAEDRDDLIRRWLDSDHSSTPRYICADCGTPFSGEEVPA